MRTNKILAAVLAAAVATLMTACSGADESSNEEVTQSAEDSFRVNYFLCILIKLVLL